MKRANKLAEAQALISLARKQVKMIDKLGLSKADLKRLKLGLVRTDSWLESVDWVLRNLKDPVHVPTIKRGTK